ncbi:RHS repeat domain-containing protein [Fluviispira vulneris]|uniref:RHS repeat domain-containing protein n=1 Tax=Fluviispira vulneris TaxID=2763012 RepID=UPI0016447DCD|nr:RHS repeat domain-containing protein [Fluviispira vulneris]
MKLFYIFLFSLFCYLSTKAQAEWNFQTPLTQSVNPQNGALKLTYPIGAMIKRGEIEFQLIAKYDQVLKENLFGLGKGWTFPFTKIVNDKIYLKEGGIYTLKNKKIEGLNRAYPKFTDYEKGAQKTPDNREFRYLLTYLNGNKVYLNNKGNEIYREDRYGNSIKVFYNSDNSIQSIVDCYENYYALSANDLIDDETGKTSTGTTLTLSKDGITQETILKFILDDYSQLHKIIQFKDNTTFVSNKFLFSKLNDGVYTEIISATGVVTSIEYLKIPNSKNIPIYSVGKIQVLDNKKLALPSERYEYTFSNKNFADFIDPQIYNDLSTQNQKDLLYKTRFIKGLYVTEYTYNHLNLLVAKVIYKNTDLISKVKYKYQGQNAKEQFPPYSKLENNYNLLAESSYTFCKGDKESFSNSFETALVSVENFFKTKVLGDNLSSLLPDCKGINYREIAQYDNLARLTYQEDKFGFKYNYSYFDENKFGLLKRKEVQSLKDNKMAESYTLTEDNKSIYSKTDEVLSQGKWQQLYINQYAYFPDGEKKKSIFSYSSLAPRWFKGGNILSIQNMYTNNLQDKSIMHDPNSIVKLTSSKDFITGESRITSETFDKATGKLIKKEDGLNRSTQYFYDYLGNLTKIVYADGSHVAYYYMIGKNGQKSVSIQMNSYGETKKYYYDALGNLLLKARVLFNGDEKPYETFANPYEAQNYQIMNGLKYYTLSNNMGSFIINFSKDMNGNIKVFQVTLKNPISDKKLAEYTISAHEINYMGDNDKLFKVLSKIIENKSTNLEKETGILKSTVYEYDDWNQLVKETNQVGDSISYTYNPARQLIAKTLQDNKTSIYYEYNLLGKLRYTSVAKSSESYQYPIYDYNIYGDLISSNSKLNTINYTYNKASELIKMDKGSHRIFEYAYDVLGRKIQEINTFDKINTIYSYGKNGKVESITENGSEISYSYSHEGRLLEKKFPNKKFISYTYNSLGQKTSMKNIIGDITRYSYDHLNRLTQASSNSLGNVDIVYDSFGNIIKKTYPQKSQREFKYDLLNRPIEIIFSDKKNNFINRQNITYDLRGNISTKTFSSTRTNDLESNNTTLYEYDRLNRLIKETVKNTENKISYENEFIYDITNNITTKTQTKFDVTEKNKKVLTKNIIKYTYNSLLKLSAINNNGKITEISYDPVWNPTTDENGRSLVYNNKDQLLSRISPGKPFTAYMYFPDGYLGAIYYGNNIDYYYYDENGHLVNEIDEDGKATSYLIVEDGLKEN